MNRNCLNGFYLYLRDSNKIESDLRNECFLKK